MEFLNRIADFIDWGVADYPYVGVALAFILGAIVGSFLNVCIARMPLQKSVLWPSSRCGQCLQPIRAFDNIPLISYWLLKGKCRQCGATFSSRYFWVELFTATAFAGLFWLEVVQNIHHVAELPSLPGPIAVAIAPGAAFSLHLFFIWLYHAVLLSFLIVATMTDFDYMQIPIGLTVFGAIIGVIGGTLMPWPWPTDVGNLDRNLPNWQNLQFGGMGLLQQNVFLLPSGAQWWPFWMPTSTWFPPGSWQMGLATSLVGAVAGTLLVRLIRIVFGYGLGKEAMGMGDADLMMMIGAFLGWQALIFTLGFAVVLGLVYAVSLVIRNKGHELPFGPFLAGGAVATMLLSWWLGTIFQPAFFDLAWLVILTIVTSVLAFFLSLALRMLRLIGQTA